MRLKDINMFLNDNYVVLFVLYEHQQEINGNTFTAITQNEIGESLGFSLMKVNGIIGKLKKAKYVTQYRNARGRYQLTNKAYLLIQDILQLQSGKEKD